jgi:hypothetical protein
LGGFGDEMEIACEVVNDLGHAAGDHESLPFL